MSQWYWSGWQSLQIRAPNETTNQPTNQLAKQLAKQPSSQAANQPMTVISKCDSQVKTVEWLGNSASHGLQNSIASSKFKLFHGCSQALKNDGWKLGRSRAQVPWTASDLCDWKPASVLNWTCWGRWPRRSLYCNSRMPQRNLRRWLWLGMLGIHRLWVTRGDMKRGMQYEFAEWDDCESVWPTFFPTKISTYYLLYWNTFLQGIIPLGIAFACWYWSMIPGTQHNYVQHQRFLLEDLGCFNPLQRMHHQNRRTTDWGCTINMDCYDWEWASWVFKKCNASLITNNLMIDPRGFPRSYWWWRCIFF